MWVATARGLPRVDPRRMSCVLVVSEELHLMLPPVLTLRWGEVSPCESLGPTK